jgi:large subunit ribosomal protein L21
MYAIVKSGGRQYKVAVGEKLEVNRLTAEDGSQIELDQVLLISGENTSLIGSPLVEGAKVVATVVGQKRGPKLIVFKYKSKKRYRHRRGHRQELTLLSIDDILANGKSLIEAKSATETEAAPAKKPRKTAKAREEAVVNEAAETAPEASTEEKKPRRRRTSKASETESTSEE